MIGAHLLLSALGVLRPINYDDIFLECLIRDDLDFQVYVDDVHGDSLEYGLK